MRHVLGGILLLGLIGCTPNAHTTHSMISPGARQDSNYEIQGKPQGAGEQSEEVSGVGYDNRGGQVNAQQAEQEAAGEVHYHYHTHNHIYGAPGSSTEVAGMPQGAGQGATPAGYAAPSYSVQQHHSSMNPYATPYSVVRGPYSGRPNAGNASKRAYPYYTDIYGTWGIPGGDGWGVGSAGWGSGGVNFN